MPRPEVDPLATAKTPHELDAILDTIREVEENLERRAERAGGAVNVVWGIVVGGIFAFYHVVGGNPAPFEAAFGALLPWLWLAPTALGYALTVAIGARLGRVGAPGRNVRVLLWSLLPLIFAIAVFSAVEGLGRFIPALAVGFLGWTCAGITWGDSDPGARRWRAVAVLSVVAALVLLLPVVAPWANLAAGAWYAVMLAGAGSLQYVKAR